MGIEKIAEHQLASIIAKFEWLLQFENGINVWYDVSYIDLAEGLDWNLVGGSKLAPGPKNKIIFIVQVPCQPFKYAAVSKF